jgi:hypothetical protein
MHRGLAHVEIVLTPLMVPLFFQPARSALRPFHLTGDEEYAAAWITAQALLAQPVAGIGEII